MLKENKKLKSMLIIAFITLLFVPMFVLFNSVIVEVALDSKFSLLYYGIIWLALYLLVAISYCLLFCLKYKVNDTKAQYSFKVILNILLGMLLNILGIVFLWSLLWFVSYIDSPNYNEKRFNYFNQQVEKYIKGKNSVIVDAKDLTNFEWDKVCFRRHESYGLPYIPFISSGKGSIELNFYTEKNEKKIESFELSFSDYYLDEPYVQSTPKCLHNREKLLLFRYVTLSSDKRINFLMPDTKKLFGSSIEKFLQNKLRR